MRSRRGCVCNCRGEGKRVRVGGWPVPAAMNVERVKKLRAQDEMLTSQDTIELNMDSGHYTTGSHCSLFV